MLRSLYFRRCSLENLTAWAHFYKSNILVVCFTKPAGEFVSCSISYNFFLSEDVNGLISLGQIRFDCGMQ